MSGGKRAFMSPAVRTPRVGAFGVEFGVDAAELEMFLHNGVLTSFPLSAALHVHRFLSHCGVTTASDFKLIQRLTMRKWNFKRDDSVAYFRVLFTSLHLETCIPCVTKAKISQSTEAPLPFGLGTKLKPSVGSVKSIKSAPKGKASSSKGCKHHAIDLDSDLEDNTVADSDVAYHSDCERSWSSSSASQCSEDPGANSIKQFHQLMIMLMMIMTMMMIITIVAISAKALPAHLSRILCLQPGQSQIPGGTRASSHGILLPRIVQSVVSVRDALTRAAFG